MLMLSFVALRRSDAVGMLAFSDGIHHYVPPRSGMQQMNRLLHATFDRFPRLVESHYDEAFLYLASHARKRSLVILVTNLIDEVNSHQVEQYLTNLVGRHLPLCVLLRDHQLFDAAEAPTAGDPALFRAAAAAEIHLAAPGFGRSDEQGRAVARRLSRAAHRTAGESVSGDQSPASALSRWRRQRPCRHRNEPNSPRVFGLGRRLAVAGVEFPKAIGCWRAACTSRPPPAAKTETP